MKTKIGVMGSAGDLAETVAVSEIATSLAAAFSKGEVVLLTGGTTGLVYAIGRAAHDAGVFHIGISPGSNQTEHLERFKLPVDACDAIVYTGFGLKGRNVVLVRSCDIVLFVAGAMGSLNEFTIAHDEGKIIGCLTGTGGVADEADYLLDRFSKDTGARVFQDSDSERLVETCLSYFRMH